MNRAETSRWEPESCSTWFPWTQYQSVRAGMQPSRDQALPPDPDLGLSSLGLCPCTDGLHRTLVSLLKIRALGLRLGHLLQNFPNALSAWLLGHRLFLDIHSGPLRRSSLRPSLLHWLLDGCCCLFPCPLDVTFCYTWLSSRICHTLLIGLVPGPRCYCHPCVAVPWNVILRGWGGDKTRPILKLSLQC